MTLITSSPPVQSAQVQVNTHLATLRISVDILVKKVAMPSTEFTVNISFTKLHRK
jgi:hypothetical protein